MATHMNPVYPSCPRVARISSFDQNPAKGITPASDTDPITKVQKVTGILRRRPPMSLMLLEWTAWMTDPAPRNNRALKKAWVKRWNSPAVYPPAATAAIM